ncbi:phage holin family protein [Clostridium sp. MSJ-11]|uniref:Phage holin family protein n=1 Tax=Clostridium mobile TaxID=2841512 RepID=A0ABS6EMJ5_9CLOT|nr:phage holin family protein [Clostridium mobile]
MNIMEYVVEQAFILIPALYFLGLMLKGTKKIQDWTIPWILLICGIAGAIALMGLNIDAVIQGVIVTGVTVYANQLIKQSTEKRG